MYLSSLRYKSIKLKVAYYVLGPPTLGLYWKKEIAFSDNMAALFYASV